VPSRPLRSASIVLLAHAELLARSGAVVAP
jgi:hypothetical protein